MIQLIIMCTEFKTIVTISHQDAVLIHDAVTGMIIDVNDDAVRMFGYDSKAEILSCNISLLRADTAGYTEKKAFDIIRSSFIKDISPFDWLLKKKDGATFHGEVSLYHTSIHGDDLIFVRVTEIDLNDTSQKTLQLFKDVFDRSTEACAISNSAGTLLYPKLSDSIKRQCKQELF